MALKEQIKNASFHLLEEVDIQLPFWRYFEIFQKKPYAYFLDSSLANSSLGSYSFMGSDPFLVYKAFIGQTDEKGRVTGDVELL